VKLVELVKVHPSPLGDWTLVLGREMGAGMSVFRGALPGGGSFRLWTRYAPSSVRYWLAHFTMEPITLEVPDDFPYHSVTIEELKKECA